MTVDCLKEAARVYIKLLEIETGRVKMNDADIALR